MELWIRSQSKSKLEKVEYLDITKYGEGEYEIESNTTSLGTYETEERALEILDEIQSAMITLAINGDCVYIYEMPKE